MKTFQDINNTFQPGFDFEQDKSASQERKKYSLAELSLLDCPLDFEFGKDFEIMDECLECHVREECDQMNVLKYKNKGYKRFYDDDDKEDYSDSF